MKAQQTKQSERMQWRGQSCHLRLGAISRIYIEHGAIKNLLEHIERQLLIAKSRNLSSGSLVIAPSGAGKSSFIEHLHRVYPDVVTPELTQRPVVHFKIPSTPTAKQLGAAFLKALGDPSFKAGTAEEKMERISVLIKACKTLIIAIDDFQDVPARRGALGVKAVGDWVRDVCEMKFSGIVLAFGTEDAAVVRDSNVQLGRRMMARVDLPTFTLQNTKNETSFGALLGKIDEQLPLAESSGLQKSGLAARIFRATNGNFDYLMKLLCVSLIRAVEKGMERIEMQDLEAGFLDLHQVAAHRGNPFSESYGGETLDLPGQIFFKPQQVEEKAANVKNNPKSGKA